MTIQLLLIGALLLLALIVVRHMKASRRARLIVLAVLAAGAYLVWQPTHASSIAHLLGVGRGADLLLYFWIILTFSVILLLYLKLVEMNQMLTELARRLTLLCPIPPASRGGELPRPADALSGAIGSGSGASGPEAGRSDAERSAPNAASGATGSEIPLAGQPGRP